MKKNLLFPVFFLFVMSNMVAQTLITNVSAHIGNGTLIENAAIAIAADGKIQFVAPMTDARVQSANFKELINGIGHQAYPGMIAPDNQLGLREVEAVRATNDFSEVGKWNPSVRAIIAYNTDSKVIPTIRSNGVLMAQISPKGGQISGKSSIVTLQNGPLNWEDVAYKTDEGMWLQWPGRFAYAGWWGEPEPAKKSDGYSQNLNNIKDFFKEAYLYCQQKEHETKNLKFEAMRPLFSGQMKLYVRVDDAQSIMEMVQWTKSIGVKSVVVGANESWRIADFLAKENVPVILNQVHNLPLREDDDIDMPFKTAKILSDAGVLFCFSIEDYWQQRNLMFQAGQSVAYGLPKEMAIAGLTGNTARILGLDATCGTLEPGKDATLILTKGDLLEIRTSVVTHAFIKGNLLDLEDKQKALFRSYMKKFGL
jgi:imidazolonepropionase-like amidohydrolase